MVILPRQARDKHRENSKMCRFLAVHLHRQQGAQGKCLTRAAHCLRRRPRHPAGEKETHLRRRRHLLRLRRLLLRRLLLLHLLLLLLFLLLLFTPSS